MTPVSEVLGAAADLLEKPGAWTQGHLGRDEAGEPITTPSDLPRAKCYCMAGALWVASGLKYPTEAFDALLPGLGGGKTGSWNDEPGRTQAEVVDALRQAAAQASRQPNTGEASNVR